MIAVSIPMMTIPTMEKVAATAPVFERNLQGQGSDKRNLRGCICAYEFALAASDELASIVITGFADEAEVVKPPPIPGATLREVVDTTSVVGIRVDDVELL